MPTRPSSMATRLFAALGLLFFTNAVLAQTTLISPSVNNGGFESGTTGWTFVQNTVSTTSANKWEISGTPGINSGTNAAYITTGATGAPWSYSGTSRTSHMYQDVTFPAAEPVVTLSFYIKCNGEADWDRLLVYLVPTTVTPTAGSPSSNSTTLSSNSPIYTQPSSLHITTTSTSTPYTLVTMTIPASVVGNTSASVTKRLIFTWQNDAIGTYNPPIALDDITLISACQGAVGTLANSVTATTATLNWTAFTGATGYSIRYKKVSDPATTTTWATPTTVTGGTTTSLAVTGLTANSQYEYQVAATGTGVCNTISSSVLFNTPCSPVAITQSEGFNASSIPACWTMSIVTTGSTQPAITFVTSGSSPTVSAPQEGSYMVRFNGSSASSNSQIRLVALPVSTTGTASVDVEFQWWHDNVASTSTTTDGVQVQYSTDNVTWFNAGSFIPRVNGTNGWLQKVVTLPSAAGNVGTLYVGLLFTSQAVRNHFVDAFTIKQTPACGKPTGLTATATSATTATASWLPSTAGTLSGYEYVVSTSNTAPTGSGTPVSTNSVTITSGISQNTTYYMFVRKACTGSIYSDWSPSVTFTTPCAVVSLPQTELFNATTTPSCWTKTIVNDPGTDPEITFTTATGIGSTATACSTANPLAVREGTHMIKFNSFNASTNAQIRLASLPVNTTGAPSVDVSFLWYHDNCDYTSNNDNVQVQYSLNGTTWTNAGSAISRPNSSVASGWYNKTVTLPAAAANVSQLYVGFLFTSGFGNHCFMDSIAIVQGASCVTPTGVSAANVTNSTATLNWTAPIAGNTPAGYQYVVSTSSTAPTGAGTNIGTNSLNATGLLGNTTYYAFVRTDCGSSSYSSWSAAGSFTTQCDGVILPFKESFSATALPSCWQVTEGTTGSSTHWEPVTADGSHGASASFAGTHFARLDVWNAFITYNPYYLRMVPVSVPNGNTDLSYYYFLGSGGYSGSSPYPLQVEVSTNWGNTWTAIYSHTSSNSTMATSSAVSNWTKNTVSLNAYKGQTVMLRFRSNSNYGSGTCNQGLDEIAVSLKAPSVTNSTQCGTATPTASATSNTGVTTPVFKWYTVSSGGTALTGQSGATLSGYPISATTTFYVSEVIGTAESERVAVTATYNPQPAVSITASNNITCYAGNDGSATATATGSTGYNYSWNTAPAQTTAVATGLIAGSYTVTVTNTNGSCPATASITLTQPTQAASIPAISVQPSTTTVCSTGTATFTAAATGLNITYQWQSDNGSGSTFTNITNGGMYSGATTGTLTITGVTSSMHAYKYRLVASGTCSPAATSSAAVLGVSYSIPSVSVSASATTICSGTTINFTATPVNPGTTPTYQWRVNNTNVGTNSATYSSATLANGDVVAVDMTSNATCAIPATVTSTGIDIIVNPIVTPSVSITRSTPSNTICAGTSVTYTATPVNGGSSPFYQWKIGSTNVGTGGSTFTTTTLNNNDVVSVQMTSNAPCPTVATVSSNTFQMTVTPIVTPTISIAASNTNICAGTSVTFTATITNGGGSPVRTWRRNGSVVGTNSNTYTTSSLSNGDVITCDLTSSVSCPSQTVVTSNSIFMSVTNYVTPVVSISANPGNTICAGTAVTFNAFSFNGGSTPSYQWKKNNVNVGTNSTTYSAGTGLAPGDVITCTMTTSVMCYTSLTGVSNTITMVVNPILVPSVTAIASEDTICDGDQVNFTLTTINPGTAPQYQWKLNGSNILGATANTYSTASLNDGDKVSVELLSNALCVSPARISSNPVTMKVNPLLTPTVKITADDPDSTICNGSLVTFTASHVNGGVMPKYQWILNGLDMVGAIAGTFSMNTMSNGDIVTLRMTSTATCPIPATVNANSIRFKVEPTTPPTAFITATPDARIMPGDTVKFSATVLNAGTAPTFQWTINDSVIAGAVGSTYTTHQLQSNDVVKLIVRSSLPCSDPDSGMSNSITMLDATGVDLVDRQFNDVKLYPNPNNGNFTIEAKFVNITNDANAKIEVLNSVGQLVFKDDVEILNGEMKKDVRLMGVANGTYYIRLSSGSQSVMKPLNIQQQY